MAAGTTAGRRANIIMRTLELLEEIISEVSACGKRMTSTEVNCEFPDFRISPRQRLLERVEQLTATQTPRLKSQFAAELYANTSPRDRMRLQIQNQLAWHRFKCEKVGACLACCIFPCICGALQPLKLSHRLWVVTHSKEVLRTTATGKLLLLAHPQATLLVSGVPEHDAELQRLCQRETAVVLFPSSEACTPAELLEEARRRCSSGGGGGFSSSSGGGSSSGSNNGSNRGSSKKDGSGLVPVLDVLVLDGTWNQARWLYRTLPSNLRSVVVDCSNVRSLFGTKVRKQGAAREAAGRVSTLEAYCFLALALGDAPEEVAKLGEYLETFVRSLPYQRPDPSAQPTVAADDDDGANGTDTAVGAVEGAHSSACTASAGAQTPLQHPSRSPTNPYRRRARRLSQELGRSDAWREGGREVLASFLDGKPSLTGTRLGWRVLEVHTEGRLAGPVAALVTLDSNGKAGRVVAEWPVSTLLVEGAQVLAPLAGSC